MAASTTLGPCAPVHSRIGGCGPAAPYLQHCCYWVQPSLQCGCAPGPRRAGQCMRRRGGPQHGCEHSSLWPGPRHRLPRPGLLRAAAGSVLPLPRAPRDCLARTGCARPRACHLRPLFQEEGPDLQPPGHPSHRGCARLGIPPQCLQCHKQSPGAGYRGRFIRGAAERDKHGKVLWYFPAGC